jgi:hypothetical protein
MPFATHYRRSSEPSLPLGFVDPAVLKARESIIMEWISRKHQRLHWQQLSSIDKRLLVMLE